MRLWILLFYRDFPLEIYERGYIPAIFLRRYIFNLNINSTLTWNSF
jgi:hypothetical protein